MVGHGSSFLFLRVIKNIMASSNIVQLKAMMFENDNNLFGRKRRDFRHELEPFREQTPLPE